MDSSVRPPFTAASANQRPRCHDAREHSTREVRKKKKKKKGKVEKAVKEESGSSSDSDCSSSSPDRGRKSVGSGNGKGKGAAHQQESDSSEYSSGGLPLRPRRVRKKTKTKVVVGGERHRRGRRLRPGGHPQETDVNRLSYEADKSMRQRSNLPPPLGNGGPTKYKFWVSSSLVKSGDNMGTLQQGVAQFVASKAIKVVKERAEEVHLGHRETAIAIAAVAETVKHPLTSEEDVVAAARAAATAATAAAVEPAAEPAATQAVAAQAVAGPAAAGPVQRNGKRRREDRDPSATKATSAAMVKIED